MRLEADLQRFPRLALDANVCVYYLQREPSRFSLASELIVSVGARSELCIPDIVRLELLIHPYRTGYSDEMDSVRELLTRGTRIGMDDAVVEAAAQLRGMMRLPTPDALVAACAAVGRCGAIVGNDAVFKDLNAMQGMTLLAAGQPARIPQYIHLDDYINGA